MQDILHPGSENSMNVLLAQCDLLKKQNNSISDNMQICAHIQHILTPKDLPRNRSCPSTVHIDLERFQNLHKNHPNSLFSLLQMRWKMKYFLVQVNSSLSVWKKSIKLVVSPNKETDANFQ